jgi:hypothetical protein
MGDNTSRLLFLVDCNAFRKEREKNVQLQGGGGRQFSLLAV